MVTISIGSIDHLLIFNNGYLRPTDDNGDIPFSSIEEIVTPLEENSGYVISENDPYGPDEYFWYYTDNNSFSNIQSGAFRLDNGNTLISWGTVSNHGAIITEVNYEKEIVLEIEYPNFYHSYKVRKRNWEFDINLMEGDLNLDEQVDVLDIINVVNFILSDENPNPFYLYKSDLDRTGQIDIIDVLSILEIIL